MKFWTPSVKVGLMLVIAVILFAILLTNAGNWPWSTQGNDIYFQFRAVNGLYPGAGIYLSGVRIGKVTGIELQAETNTVKIRARVKEAFKLLRKGCNARISMSGFVGEIYIALDNGDIGNPALQPADLPIIGIDPVNPLELLEQTSSGLNQAIELTAAANKLLQTNQSEIQQGIKDARELLALTGKTLEKFTKNMDDTVATLMDLADNYDKRFQHTLLKTNRMIDQLTDASLIISSQISDVNRSLLRLIDQNSPKINNILTDLQRSTTDFRQTITLFRQNSTELKTELSTLIAQSSKLIETGTTDVKPILKNLQTATAAITTLETNISELVNTVKHGEGTVAQLLNNPELFEDTRKTLTGMNEVVTSLKEFYEETAKRAEAIKLPEFELDYELRYLGVDKNLHNELAFLLVPPTNSFYRFGLGIRDEKIGVDLQYAYNFTDYLQGSAGFTRSKVGAGIELWMLSRRLGIALEGVSLTSDKPELNAELIFRIYRGAHLLVGVEDWRGERNWITGFRLLSREW